ncbi:2-oxoglutarate dehydrogenase complex dihydrolipoyllysine-residue succinyltransferase [Afifella marina]|uniref:Dihydrolipoyllysine-residue succinyltransferase component of 2-oxoglutarate dehydrogenase complex n=1 Tax=Afifella marina DSM 2698 TaxID=1120955 RepID=A0A1G5NML4_AFIMA|nr:2-oxoglutarate dehydrogenase complex dihydrolipoyllysine-residue succinyltransferase [Afifella marina]MBK1624641.1 dihydrolipoyllysine-residue succinyltransferase [Afifella marina DSM 2698]MBK1627534.1 dihydrolipoyllysine-residue succinyltransferase [Afifella marina]MBK5918592.1 dihydrolipoamide succinyltransferase [Afifella marina]RAI18508.1 dihydrolipoyllysine-residue succinyltransferase [Afifella marina DSM 2698]SCZ38627.1 2-oxoglutarate dehydrogenase E2 component [Afifella marina DSM 26
MTTDIKVPTLGESVTEATVGQWFKKEGEAVSRDEPLVELETDKVTVEVPAPSEGTLESIVVKAGETVEVGTLLGSIAAGDGKAKPAEKPAAAASNGSGKAEKSAAAPAAEPASEDGSGEGELIDIVVPSAGESVTEADVGEWLKQEGEEVALDEAVVELETDKAAQEIPAQAAGVLAEIIKKQGETVTVGQVLGRIRVGAKGAKTAEASAPKAENTETAPAAGERKPAPSAAKMMEEKGLAAADMDGSGKKGQVLKGDVLKALEQGSEQPQAKPSAPRAPSPEADETREERVKMTRLRQTIARRLKEAQNTAAMLTTFNDVDMGAVMDLRKTYRDLFEKKHGVRLGFMGFFVKAAVAALKEIPAVNAEIDGTDLVYKNYYHIGVAVGTDKGLVVPVVRDAQDMSVAEIEKEIGSLGKKARDGSLTLQDMQGGTFTISNGGVYGSLMSTPILNAPQSGILGMHRIEERPVVRNGQVVVRPMMYLALSYDHRVVDGQEAVTFLVRIKEAIEDPQRLVLDL